MTEVGDGSARHNSGGREPGMTESGDCADGRRTDVPYLFGRSSSATTSTWVDHRNWSIGVTETIL